MIQAMRVGDARVSVLNVGDITLPLGESFRAPQPPVGKETVESAIATHRLMPMRDVIVELGGEIIVVDAGEYDVDPGSSYAIAGYAPPPPVDEQMRALGLEPERVAHVVITHRHWDHFNGTAAVVDGVVRLRFPSARHYLGANDWPATQAQFADAQTREARTIAHVHAAGQLELVSAEREIVPGVMILPAPGETDGHQIVRVMSRDETLLAVGDLYHHPVEVSYPRWMVTWANEAQNVESRGRVVRDGLARRAAIVASHIPTIGRLAGSPESARWEDVRV